MTITSFENALAYYDIPYPPKPIADARFTRWGNNGRYWARKVDNGYIFGDFVVGLSTYWFPDARKRLPYEEYLERKRKLILLHIEQEKQQKEWWETVAQKAQRIWQESEPASATHPYLRKKNVQSFGLRFNSNALVIPLQDPTGKIWSLQFINSDGSKRFLSGGKTKGCFHAIGDWLSSNTLYIAEGYATAATIHAISDKPVLVAFNAGNLDPVIGSIMPYCRDKLVVIAADNDCWGDTNTGRNKAEAAARKYGCYITTPIFDENLQNGGLTHDV